MMGMVGILISGDGDEDREGFGKGKHLAISGANQGIHTTLRPDKYTNRIEVQTKLFSTLFIMAQLQPLLPLHHRFQSLGPGMA